MKHVAFFGGINVGGNSVVQIANLKQLFCDLGFSQVKTNIKSENVVLDTEKSTAVAIEKIQEGFFAPLAVPLRCCCVPPGIRQFRRKQRFIDCVTKASKMQRLLYYWASCRCKPQLATGRRSVNYRSCLRISNFIFSRPASHQKSQNVPFIGTFWLFHAYMQLSGDDIDRFAR